MRLAAVLVCACSVAAAATAHAAPPGETAPFAPIVFEAPAPTRLEGYRGRLAVADLASAAGIALGIAADSDALTAIGAVGAFTLAPAAHLLTHNPEHAVVSLGLRLGLPLAGLLVGSAAGTGRGSAVGLGVGAAGAIAIDYAVLARRRVTERTWTPTAGASRDAVALGVAARF